MARPRPIELVFENPMQDGFIGCAMPVAYKFDKLHIPVALALNLNIYDWIWIEVILLHDQLFFYHSAGKRDRDLTPSPYNARWPEGPRAPLSERSEL